MRCINWIISNYTTKQIAKTIATVVDDYSKYIIAQIYTNSKALSIITLR